MIRFLPLNFSTQMSARGVEADRVLVVFADLVGVGEMTGRAVKHQWPELHAFENVSVSRAILHAILIVPPVRGVGSPLLEGVTFRLAVAIKQSVFEAIEHGRNECRVPS